MKIDDLALAMANAELPDEKLEKRFWLFVNAKKRTDRENLRAVDLLLEYRPRLADKIGIGRLTTEAIRSGTP